MISRRDLMTWWRPRPADGGSTLAPPPRAARPGVGRAVDGPPPLPPTLVPRIDGEACLATRTMCSVCVERCPRPGAIVVEAGRPRVVAAACDGCGRCLAVCPAPSLAIGLVARTEAP